MSRKQELYDLVALLDEREFPLRLIAEALGYSDEWMRQILCELGRRRFLACDLKAALGLLSPEEKARVEAFRKLAKPTRRQQQSEQAA